ncbi:alpha/beta fold hydrolase [Roseivivax isoporae]|uniref:Alpha/beta hydrolase n=1 Tax=Roseivivax isoporae LMG 25204 TaxID=1449351 RepID=X7FAU9_9RHOB|nr:alpha/beta hydrolase [Roseivivax isoporae]ETX29214.1 alpha/beta hydrolase [Roseivivax isoporae LMG 25204]
MSEALVLVPGIGADARLFRPQIEHLSRRRPVTVVPAARGERIEEMASDILPHLPQRFALAGHGLGGMVAMEIVRRAPDRVTRIALLSTSPLPDTPPEAAAREPRLIAARSGRLSDALSEEVPATALAPGPGRMAIAASFREMALSIGPESYSRQVRALQRRKDQQATLRRLRVPALVLCGAHDTLHPVRRQSFLAELIPNAVLEVIDEAGHLPTLETPEAVTEALGAWLAAPMVPR